MTYPDIETWTAGRISESRFEAACRLHHAVFPKPGRTLERVLAKKRPIWMADPATGELPPHANIGPPRRYVIVRDARVIANAAVLVRRITTAAGPMNVLGLFDVASDPACRGQGLAHRLLDAAFAPVQRGELPFALFQTQTARGFYERLGSRVVHNTIIDSTHPDRPGDNPFPDAFTMIHPARRAWPEGLVDLRGPGY